MTIESAQSLHSPASHPAAADIGEAPTPLEHFEPRPQPHRALALLNEARLLCQAAHSDPGTSACDLERADLLFKWAEEFHQKPAVSDSDLCALAMSLAMLPEPLIRLAGLIGACSTAQDELNRLKVALDNPRPGSGMVAQTLASPLRCYADHNQNLLDEARDKLETGQLRDLPALARQIQEHNAKLRHALELKDRPVPTGRPTEAFGPSGSASKIPNPGTALRSAFSHLAQTARSARQAVVRHLSPHEIQRQRTEARLRLQTSQLPLKDELSLLDQDLAAAQRRTKELEVERGAHAGQKMWAKTTLNKLLAPALQAQAQAQKAFMTQGRDSLATARSAVSTIRASLAHFNQSLQASERAPVAFGFLQRPWEPGAPPAR